MKEIAELSLVQWIDRLSRREASPVELMEGVLARIEATRETLNAVVAMRERDELLAEARACEARIGADEARPLEGIPFGVKDLENVAGLVTSHASRLFRDNVAERDDVHVSRLRAAGAIVVGKTTAPEFGPTAITKSLLHGVTRSPWNLERTPGGSSGGSSAALAGGVLPLATASDGGGSIRIPAAWAGLYGLKPSQGRVPRGPSELWDSTYTSVYGPLTKTVEDAALILDLIAGPSPHDPVSLPAPGVSYREVVSTEPPQGLRIAYSPDFGRVVVQQEVGEAVEDGVRTLEKLGHGVELIEGGPPHMAGEWIAQAGWGMAGRLHDLLSGREDDIQRYLLAMIRQAEKMTPQAATEIQRVRARARDWCAAVFESFDLLVTPTTPYEPVAAKGPFPTETDGRPQRPDAVGSFTMPFNLNWNPAASLRVGLTRSGLPIGMQIVGPHHRDDLVLAISRGFERERPWHPHWPQI